ncbi:MAG: hypothetical protein WCF67_21135 [Chitinophagaceae bacterium]
MSDHLKDTRVLLIGTGYMAREYAKVLLALKVPFDVAGRGEDNCKLFRDMHPGVHVMAGGVEKCDLSGKYSHAIVASSVEALFPNTKFLLKQGLKSILLEKPGGKNGKEIKKLAEKAKEHDAVILLAYNRRFYSSVRKAKECIEEDGGVLSYNFEFTEWTHTIESLNIPEEVKQNWFLANSTHVIDTAFYLGGVPKKLTSLHKGSLPWHSSAAVFAGAGISETGALFTYQANWKSPGRWSVEMLTANRRFIFRPMEMLHVQPHRSVAITEMEVDNQVDKDFKPGLYLQTQAFLNGHHNEFCTIQHQQEILKYYNSISNY